MESPILPRREKRMWGEFIEFTNNQACTVKILRVLKNEAFSLQYHEHRTEFWYVISGSGVIQIGEHTEPVVANKEYEVPPKTMHRITAHEEDVVILEVSTGTFDEQDIVRIEDKYGRA